MRCVTSTNAKFVELNITNVSFLAGSCVPARRVTAVVITTTTVVRNARPAMAQAKSGTNQISRITAEIKRRWHRQGEVTMWRGLNRGGSQMILTAYEYDPETEKSQSVYLLRHHSKVKKTTLEQKLTVKNDAFGRFKPFVELEDFPEGLSELEAMLKLADWLHRLSVAIEDNWSTP